MENGHDIIVIGGGPIGITVAIQAKKEGLKYLVIEKGVLVNSLFHFPTNMIFFSTSQLLEIGDVPFIAHGDKPTRRESLEYFRRVVQSWNLNINLYEKVNSISKNGGSFLIKTSRSEYHAKNVVLATGFYDTPNMMGIPGESLAKVKHYYDEPHPYVGQKIVVVGAGNSSADVALETYLKGSEVTLVIRENEFKESVKYWIRPNIINRIEEGSIKCFYNSVLYEIREREVDIKTQQGKVTIANDFVLAMTGYRPDYPLLRNAGVKIQKDEFQLPVFNEETLQSNIANLYLAGVMIGGLRTGKWFIENTRDHDERIINDIKKK